MLFAPGFQDPQSEEYWSYAFTVWIDGPIPDASGLADLLDAYYDGLISMAARAEGKDVGDDPARVEVQRASADGFDAAVHLSDASGTSEPVHLRLRIAGEVAERALLRIQVSPQPSGHKIWRSLEAAVLSIQEP